MTRFGSGMSDGPIAAVAAREAVAQARADFHEVAPKLAIVFASVGYPGVDDIGRVVSEEIGDVPVVGGTSGGCVFGPDQIAPYGVSVVLLGGDDIEVVSRDSSWTADCLDAVTAAEEIARAADSAASRGFENFACLVFAPGVFVDGEALVAAVRKGAGVRAQLAGALTGDDLTLDRPKVYAGGRLRSDRIVVTGIYTRKPIGIAARHGWRAVAPQRSITRSDGVYLCELDGRPALDVWVEDARRAGAMPPADREDLALYLANHYPLGILVGPPSTRSSGGGGGDGSGDDSDTRELVARAPFAIRDDDAVQLSATIAEGSFVRVLHGTHDDLLRASREAAAAAVARAGDGVAGALVLACSGRLAALGDSFEQEPATIRDCVPGPTGGACVFGEIARNVRDADAFFNSTAVVVAFAG